MLEAPAKIVEIELRAALGDLDDLDGYKSVRALVRLDGLPVGSVDLPVRDGRVREEAIRTAIVCDCGPQIAQALLRRTLVSRSDAERIDVGVGVRPISSAVAELPLVSVAVCTRDRTPQLERCLESLHRLDYPHLELLVVDNAPSDVSTHRMVSEQFLGARYLCEPRPGLDRARNLAYRSANGSILAYIDDDVRVDPGWVDALVRPFLEDARVEAVTGLVFAANLETEAQVLFEQYGGFGRGYRRRWCGLTTSGDRKVRAVQIGAGGLGTGANMAFRREVLERLGGFDSALDVGTQTCGGGDLDMFYRVIDGGGLLVYEPAAVVFHEHRRTLPELRTQLRNHGRGFYAYLSASVKKNSDSRWEFRRFGWWWFLRWNLFRLVRPAGFPRDLILAELKGSLEGARSYRRSRDRERRVDSANESSSSSVNRVVQGAPRHLAEERLRGPAAIRTIDIGKGVRNIEDVDGYGITHVRVKHADALVGVVNIDNADGSISSARLLDTCIEECAESLFALFTSQTRSGRGCTEQALVNEMLARSDNTGAIDENAPYVSIVIATRDRPLDLGNCLTSILAQTTSFSFEIIVVDNDPGDNETAETVRRFESVRLIEEGRPGLSYARNRGIVSARGRIIVATDDDVVVDERWLQNLVVPFERAEVLAVTGNVLPSELDTPAQRAFEAYGGLGRGFEEKEYGSYWPELYGWQAVPTWEIGATANAAFRACVFQDPAVGLLEETLGAGMPPGVGEDTYLFYKLLRRGGTIVYRPQAVVFHRHRRRASELRKQLFDYSSGHVGYHLTTLLRDGDRRSLLRIFVGLPFAHLYRILMRMGGRSDYPIRLIAIEVAGNLVGPVALWRAYRRVRRMGRSRFEDAVADVPLRDRVRETDPRPHTAQASKR